MINQSSAVIGTNLSKILVDRGIKLVPKHMTLLNELSNAINNGLLTFSNMDESYIEPSIISASTGYQSEINSNKSYVQSPHDTFMDNYIIDLQKLNTGYIAFTRSVVNKEVTLLKEELQKSLDSYKYREPEDFFNVQYFKLEDVFNSYIISNEVSTYGESSKYFFESLNLKCLTNQDFDLSKYLLTGDTEQDSFIVSWLNKITVGKAFYYINEAIREYELSIDELLDYSLVNFLFYRNLTERTDLDLGLSVPTLRNKASSNRDYFGSMLNVAVELYKRDIRNGKVLSSNTDLSFSYFNTNAIKICIYEESFEKLAEAGLSIETIFGYISSGSGGVDVTVNQLIENKELYINKWNNTRSLYLISLNNNRLDIFKQILREHFESSLNRSEINEEELQFCNENAGFLEETKKLGNAYIDDLHVSDIDDIDKIVLELVAKIRYRFTNGYFILKEMSEIMKLSDKIEPMEAALYAAIKYITDFLVDQCDIVKV